MSHSDKNKNQQEKQIFLYTHRYDPLFPPIYKQTENWKFPTTIIVRLTEIQVLKKYTFTLKSYDPKTDEKIVT